MGLLGLGESRCEWLLSCLRQWLILFLFQTRAHCFIHLMLDLEVNLEVLYHPMCLLGLASRIFSLFSFFSPSKKDFKQVKLLWKQEILFHSIGSRIYSTRCLKLELALLNLHSWNPVEKPYFCSLCLLSHSFQHSTARALDYRWGMERRLMIELRVWLRDSALSLLSRPSAELLFRCLVSLLPNSWSVPIFILIVKQFTSGKHMWTAHRG